MPKSVERSGRTKEALMGALLELAQHRHIGGISVKRLTEKANINRVTFYRHFDGMSDFLDRLIDEVLESLHHPPAPAVFRSKEGAVGYYIRFFDSVKEHESFFMTMLGHNGLPSFRRRFLSQRRVWHEAMIRANRKEFAPNISSELLAVTFVANLLSLVEYWLTEGRAHSSRYMAEQLIALTYDDVLVNYGKQR